MPPPCATAWLNGRFLPLAEARISPLDRGFLFADAVYEVMPVYGSRIYRLEQHLDRLDRSQREIRMSPAMSREAWRQLCSGLVEHNGGGDLLLYLQVTRGTEESRAHVPSPATPPTVFAMASPFPPPARDPEACVARAIRTADIRWQRCDVKSTALLANVLLKWQAQDSQATETLLFRDGWLNEGAACSVHVVRGGVLFSPPLGPAILPGITREVIHEMAAGCGVELRIEPIAEAAVDAADEILLGGSGIGMRAVTHLDDREIGDGRPGPVFRRLHAAWMVSLER